MPRILLTNVIDIMRLFLSIHKNIRFKKNYQMFVINRYLRLEEFKQQSYATKFVILCTFMTK